MESDAPASQITQGLGVDRWMWQSEGHGGLHKGCPEEAAGMRV